MKKEDKVASKSTLVNDIGVTILMVLSSIGMGMCIYWGVKGITNIVDTYQMVDELSNRLHRLEYSNNVYMTSSGYTRWCKKGESINDCAKATKLEEEIVSVIGK